MNGAWPMKLLIAIAYVFTICLSPARCEDARNEGNDKADDIIKQMAEYYTGIESLSIDVSVKLTLTLKGFNTEIASKYALSIKKPNRVAIVLKEGVGATIMTDGKTMCTYFPLSK